MDAVMLAYKNIDNLPTSVKSALVNQVECIRACEDSIEGLKYEIEQLTQKIQICTEIQIPIRAIKNKRTRRQNMLRTITNQLKAYKQGFMEIPSLGRGNAFQFNGEEKFYITALPADAPLRVFQDLKAARESGLFDEILFYTPRVNNDNDPIVAGRIGDRYFLISNYR